MVGITILLSLMAIEFAVLVMLLIVLKKKNSKKVRDFKLVYNSSSEKKFTVVPKKKFNLSEYFKSLKLENYVIFFLYVLVGLFALYILFSNYMPDVIEPINSGVYEINLNNPASKLSALYFDSDIFSDVVNGSILVDSENIVNLIFKPIKIIPKETEAVVLIEGENFGTEVYFDEKLIIPDLTEYTKIKEFDNEEVWVRNDFEYEGLEEKANVEDYIYFNFPGASVYSFKELDNGVPELTDWEAKTTRIDTTFRDNLKLAVYHGGGNLKVEFTKQDLNSYIGKDEYTLTITDFNSDKEYLKKVYEDDGDKKDSKVLGDEEDYNLNVNLERGIYYISFVKDKNNPSADSTLKDIRVGSNKVLILDKILPLEQFEFYIEIRTMEKIGFNYWHGGKDQKIKVSGDVSKTIDLDEDWKSKKYEEEFEKGSYHFDVPKGDLWIYTKIISLGEDSWFNIPTQGKNKLTINDILIIDRGCLVVNGKKFSARIKTEIKDETSKYKFQVLEKNRFLIEELTMEI